MARDADTHDGSHHQDYYIFSRESQPKSSFMTSIVGRRSIYIYIYVLVFWVAFQWELQTFQEELDEYEMGKAMIAKCSKL